MNGGVPLATVQGVGQTRSGVGTESGPLIHSQLSTTYQLPNLVWISSYIIPWLISIFKTYGILQHLIVSALSWSTYQCWEVIKCSLLPDESERHSEPEEPATTFLLCGTGSSRTAAGFTHCGTWVPVKGVPDAARAAFCALEVWIWAVTGARSPWATFSNRWLVEKPLHMQSLITIEPRFPKMSSGSNLCSPSYSSSHVNTFGCAHPSRSPGNDISQSPSSVLEGDMGGVGSSSNFFHIYSLGTVDLKKSSSVSISS